MDSTEMTKTYVIFVLQIAWIASIPIPVRLQPMVSFLILHPNI